MTDQPLREEDQHADHQDLHGRRRGDRRVADELHLRQDLHRQRRAPGCGQEERQIDVAERYRAPSKVRPDTLAKVAAAARKLECVRNLVAGELASGHSNVVGVLAPRAAAQLLADSLANGVVTSEVVNVGYTLKIRGSA